MSLNTVKYKGELLAEDERISTDTPGVLGEYKEPVSYTHLTLPTKA